MKKIAVVGGGKIGSAIVKSLRHHHFDVRLADVNKFPLVTDQVNVRDNKQLESFLSQSFDAVLCATPYAGVKYVSTCAAKLGLPYFDLTEDRESTEHVKSLKSESVLVPQCGLAPGAVSIIAANLIKNFASIKSVEIRVGALPLYPNNAIQYYLTWSTDGLVNEYCNPCQVIYNRKKMDVLPLEGYEKININGEMYEAFNTSGGIGSLAESLDGMVENLNYKTMRYMGHHQLMKFLLDDLNLSGNRDLFIQLFDQEVPQTTKDVVIVMVKVVGVKEGKFMEETYVKKIYGTETESAIQRTTVGGICGAMMSWFQGDWEKKKGFVKQEEIDWHSFTNNSWGSVYNGMEICD